jgi:hypothetical protein
MSSYFGSLQFGQGRFGSSGMSASPFTLIVDDVAVTQGQAASLMVSIDRSGGYGGAVQLSLDPEPGVTGVFAPASAVGDSSQLILTVELGKAPGVYTLRVRGSGGPGISAATSFQLTVQPASGSSVPPPERTLVVPPLRRTTVVQRDGTLVPTTTYAQDPEERRPYLLNFAPWLGPDTLGVGYLSFGGLTGFNNDTRDKELEFELAGGVAGDDYAVVVTVSSEGSRTLQRSLLIAVRPATPRRVEEAVKDPDSILDYALDFSQAMPEEVTLQSLTWTLTGGLVAESSRLEARRAIIWLSGGEAGFLARARALATLSNGWKAAVELELIIKDQ